MSRYKALFSYYGGKSKIAHLYPKPEHDHIIEPFAGGAGYSLLHHERQVTLIEKNPATYAIWRYLLDNSLDTVLRDIPEKVERGQKVSSMVGPGTDPGLVALLVSSASIGEAGTFCFADRAVTPYGVKQWHATRGRIEHYHPRIRHWKVIEGDYRDAPDVEATWHIDPPYSNRVGQRYFCKNIDYASLGEWCKSRRGQVLVCENEGATWLPFEVLATASNIKRKSVEVMWYRLSSTASPSKSPGKSKTSGRTSSSRTPVTSS